ncbi:MAG: VWA domain-containing protein, partial [Acidobacteriota bacterium]
MIVLISISLLAQELKHEVTVTLKLIPVYVTDKSGNPVTDLKKDDFVISVNKQIREVTEFERYILSPLPDKAGPQSEIKEDVPSEAANDTMNRKFFFFFDLVNNNAKGFLKAQKAALHFIDNQLQPTDEVGIISYSVLKQLTLHEYLTTDHQALRQVVERIGGTGRVGRAENFEALLYQQMTGESALDASQYGQPIQGGAPAQLSDGGGFTQSGAGAFAAGNVASNNRFQRDEYRNQIRNLFSRIIDLSKALRYISGNKHLILFSSGVPYSLIHGIETSNPFQSKDFGLDSVLRNQFDEVLKELSAANTTVFSVNTEPLATNMNLPENMKGEGTLRRLSDYTGGKFIGNVQNYKEILDTVQTFTGSYYVLGYYIDESADGRYNSIDVSVTRPQCNVFAQKGYFNPKAFATFSRMEKELHLFDLALTERPLLQTPVDFPMIALPTPVEKEAGVFLLAQIPLEKTKESIGQKAEIFFLAFDKEENLIDLKRNEVTLSTLQGSEAYYYSLMNLSPGLYKFRIVMRDMDTGNGAVGRSTMEIPVSQEQGLMLYPPLLLNPGKSGLFVRGYVPNHIKSQFPLVDYFPFDPLMFSPNLGNINGSAGKIRAVLRCSMFNLTKPVLKFTADLIERSSERSVSLPVSILSGKKEDEMGTLFAEFEMPEMAPGEYVLVISALDQTSQARSQTS